MSKLNRIPRARPRNLAKLDAARLQVDLFPLELRGNAYLDFRILRIWS